MRVLRLLAICVVLFSGFATATTVHAEPIVAERFGLYVVSDDLDRAAAFYEPLFGKPQVRVPGMIGFDVAGGLYAIVDRKTYAATAVRGDTARGYVKVYDIRAAYHIVRAAAPQNLQGSISTEGRFSFFRIRDPDGNLVEFYAIGV